MPATETSDAVMTERKSWRDVFKIHPLADDYPLMPEAELRALGESIIAIGLKHPIAIREYLDPESEITWEVLDGRNRLDAMELVGQRVMKPHKIGDFTTYNLSVAHEVVAPTIDVKAFIEAENDHRRHYTAEQKRERMAALLKANPERGDRATARIVGVDHKTVGAVRAELVENGEIPHLVRTGRAAPKAVEPPPKPPEPDRVVGDPYPDREYVPSPEALVARDKYIADALAAGRIVSGVNDSRSQAVEPEPETPRTATTPLQQSINDALDALQHYLEAGKRERREHDLLVTQRCLFDAIRILQTRTP